MFAIANGRKALWQWDLNQQLTVAGDCTEVHYLDRGAPSTLTVAVKDGKADIPNILLQKAGRLVVYAYIIDAQDHHTKVCETFGIASRPKPAEYVYTETEVKTWSNLQSQIGDLANLATEEKNNLVAAINEAARSGGGGGGGTYYVELNGNYPNYTLSETTPLADITAAYNEGKALFCRCSMDKYTATLPLFVPVPAMNIWLFSGSGGTAKMNFPAQYFTIVVSAQGVTAENKRLVQTDAIVASVSSTSTNAQVPSAKCVYDELQKRNLKQATSEVLGGVKADPATAGDTQPVRIDDRGKLVTAAGSGSDISLGLTSATVGQTIKVKTVDTDGRPTSWEAADMVSDEMFKLTQVSQYNVTDITDFPAYISLPFQTYNDFFLQVDSLRADAATTLTFALYPDWDYSAYYACKMAVPAYIHNVYGAYAIMHLQKYTMSGHSFDSAEKGIDRLYVSTVINNGGLGMSTTNRYSGFTAIPMSSGKYPYRLRIEKTGDGTIGGGTITLYGRRLA